MKEIIKNIIKHPFRSIKHPGSILYPNTWCNKVFVEFLKSKGATIGEGTRFIAPTKCHVDINRASYITIGNNCCLSFVSLLAHDYSWYTFLDAYDDILPDGGGEIVIGNNCFIGYEALILKGTIIGDNVIVGARSVVKGIIPSNTVWAGWPAKQICTLEEFYKKKEKNRINEAVYRRDFIRKKELRDPLIQEMGLFSLLFLERTDTNYNTYITDIEFNGIKGNEKVKRRFMESVPVFPSYDDFLKF